MDNLNMETTVALNKCRLNLFVRQIGQNAFKVRSQLRNITCFVVSANLRCELQIFDENVAQVITHKL